MNLISENWYALDKHRNIVSFLRPLNIQWNRRYYEAGDFSIQLMLSNYSNDYAYIFSPEKELGLVQKIEVISSGTQKYVQVSGFFAEKLLDNITIKTEWSGSFDNQDEAENTNMGYSYAGTPENVIRDMFSKSKDDSEIVLGESSGIGKSINYHNDGYVQGELGKASFDLLKTQGESLKVVYEHEPNALKLIIWEGKNRTQDQNENSFLTFASDRGSINNFTFTSDDSNLKNYFESDYILLSGESYVRKRYVLDLSNGSEKKKLKLKIGGTKRGSASVIEKEIIQYTSEQALKYINITNIDLNVNNAYYKYGVDFDLGDICDIIIPEIGISFKSRIIEIREVYKKGACTLSLVLGDKILTKNMKARLL